MNPTKLEKTILLIIFVLSVILFAIMVYLSVRPTKQAQAVEFTEGIPSETVHYFPNSERESRYAMQNDAAASLIGDCLADRVTGDLYPQPDPYCLPVPSVAVVEQTKERDTDDTQTPVIVDVPATPETPEIVPPTVEPPVITPPTEEPEQPETEQPETEPSQAGNPGNLKNVGNAGENPNGRGTMDNDNAGGNGNGQHGNQGEGGHNN